MENKLTFGPQYKVLCLGQIQFNTLLSTTPHIFQQSGGCIILWVCLQSLRTGEFFRIENKWNGAQHMQNPKGKPGSVCFPTDTGGGIHLSAEHQPKTQGQIYTGVVYQEDSECS